MLSLTTGFNFGPKTSRDLLELPGLDHDQY